LLACKNATLHLLLLLLENLCAFLFRAIEHVECVGYNGLLCLVVQRRICCERGRLIHLDEPRLELLVYHDVEAEDLETHGAIQVLRLTAAVQM